MEHCAALSDRPRRSAILHAIGEHDNGWTEEDATPLLDPNSGTIADFVHAPLSVRHRVWPRAVARLESDPWAATLVAQHAITVYDRFRPEAEWASFFTTMEAIRDRLLEDSGLPLDGLLTDYAFVRLGDLISLTFCTGWTDEQHYGRWTVRRSGATVIVTPDLFGGASIPFVIRAREIRNQTFLSDADLRDSLRDAATITLEGDAR